MDQQREHGQLHLAGFDLLAQVLGRASDHQPGDEHADDQVQQQVDHAHALAAEDAVEPHAGQRRQAGQRIEAVVGAVDGAAGDRRGHGGERRAGGGAETQLLAFQVAQAPDPPAAPGRGGLSGHLPGAPVGAGFGCSVSQYTAQTDPATNMLIIDAEDHPGVRRCRNMRPNVSTRAKGYRQKFMTLRKLLQAPRVLVGVGRIGPEEPAAVGAQVLDGDDGGDRTAGDLLLGCGLRPRRRPMTPGFDGGDLLRALEGHRERRRPAAARPSPGWPARTCRRRPATCPGSNCPCAGRCGARG